MSRSVVYHLYSLESLEFHITCIGLAQVAEFFKVHINTASRAIKAEVYKGYIISTTLLTPVQILSIKESLVLGVNSRFAKPIFIYSADQSTLLHVCTTVGMFIKLSGLSGSGVVSLCVSPTLLWRDTYFISYNLISEADNTLSNTIAFVPVPSIGATAKPVYGVPIDGGKEIR